MSTIEEQLNVFSNVYDRYSIKLDEIERFINIEEERKSILNPIFIKKNNKEIFFSERQLNYLDLLEKSMNSVVPYNAAIISLYGSFELYLDELLRAYLNYLKNTSTGFKELPDSLRNKYLSKSAEFLTNNGRFLNLGLSNENVIIGLEEAFIKNEFDKNFDKLLLTHGGNLKTTQMNQLFNEFGIKQFSAYLMKNVMFKDYIEKNNLEGNINQNSIGYLDIIVQQRNEVAHGWSDGRIAFHTLLENYIPFFRIFCKVICDAIISKVIDKYVVDKKIETFDEIIEVYKNLNVIGINSKDFTLSVGETLYCTDDYNENQNGCNSNNDNRWNYRFKILELQNDRQERQHIRARNKDITMMIDFKFIKKKYTVFKIVDL